MHTQFHKYVQKLVVYAKSVTVHLDSYHQIETENILSVILDHDKFTINVKFTRDKCYQ